MPRNSYSALNNMSKSDVGRRRFLACGLTGLAGAAVTTTQAHAETAIAIDSCTNTPAADAVLLYMDLLTGVRLSELERLSMEAHRASTALQNAFREIRDLARELESAICSPVGSAQARSVRMLAESGVTSASIIVNTAASGNAAQPHLALLTQLAEQMDQNARCLLPNGQNVISARASEIINEMLKQIAKARELDQPLTDANKAVNEGYKTLKDKLDTVRYAMLDSVQRILEAETAPSGTSTYKSQLKQASLSLEKPITELQKLLKEEEEKMRQTQSSSSKPTPSSGMERLNNLVMLLEGVALWLQNPGQFVVPAQQSSRSEPTFIRTTYDPATAVQNKTIEQEISDQYESCCGAKPSGSQINECKAAATGTWRIRANAPEALGIRASLIYSALTAANYGDRGGRLGCYDDPPRRRANLNELANKLAELAPRIV